MATIIGGVVGGVLLAAILHVWRRASQALGKANRVLATIENFGAQWEKAVALDEQIRADRSDLEALIIQMGTAGRNPQWASMEAYLHEWRHEQRNESHAMNLAAMALLRAAEALETKLGKAV